MSLTSIGMTSDHAGFELVEYLSKALVEDGFSVHPYTPSHSKGNKQAEGNKQVEGTKLDYPDCVFKMAEDVASQKISYGIAVCGTGIGMSIVANKVFGVRAAVVWDEEVARLSRLHNDANLLCLGARCLEGTTALTIVRAWLSTSFEGGRHQRRIEKILAIEDLLRKKWSDSCE